MSALTDLEILPEPTSLAVFARRLLGGANFAGEIEAALKAAIDEPDKTAAHLMDAALMLQLSGRKEDGVRAQALALQASPLFWHRPARSGGVRLLVFAAEGDVSTNAPLEFMLEDGDVTLIKFYVGSHLELPKIFPEHDVAMTTIGEGDGTLDAITCVADLWPHWPRPTLNDPSRIALLSRDRLFHLLAHAPGITMPATQRVDRAMLAEVAVGSGVLPGDLAFPVIIRPIDSHAGRNLAKLDDAVSLADYLNTVADPVFYLSRFIDYRRADGLYAKLRIAFIDGVPFLAHKAISENWMIHYLNAGMDSNPAKRADEAQSMDAFDAEFRPRHAAALAAIASQIGLEYFSVDCAEAPDGSLLIFEADVSGVVHALDSVELYPYKRPHMLRLFQAFRALLERTARGS
jgi:hypothetical protein